MRSYLIGRTLGETRHGNPGDSRVLPAGLPVRLEQATTVPHSGFVYWASPLAGYAWPENTARWAEDVGVGLYATDVEIIGGRLSGILSWGVIGHETVDFDCG